VNIFFEIHQGNLREGPGDSQSTLRALSYLKNLPANPLILDIGCGPGMQTIDLAKNTRGKIIALDNHFPFLEELKRRAESEKMSHKISVHKGSMFNLTFKPRSFNLIWSEGAIYLIGFQKGLREWKKFLKKGGYLAVTQIAWFRKDIPKELRQFWTVAYPEIKSVNQYLEIISKVNYRLIAHFPLPDSAWWETYYRAIEKKISELEPKYLNDPAALELIHAEKFEMELFRRYSAYYGYEFFIMQK
jgi:ubiquinone/menaquinone biosynthesis C-methylase UbiE